ncbi:MAG: DUF2206 domain-containing protein [Candidatus Bathyarchaeia archaeon]|jgi:uncharacterized membrane protein
MSESKPFQLQANGLSIAIILQATLILTIIFNIPFARQIIGFLYLTFVPGFAIQRLLRLKLSRVESALFDVGLSLAFLMGLGFLLNTIAPAIGLTKPLNLNFILALTSVFVITALILRRQDTYKTLKTFYNIKKSLPLLAVLGAILALSVTGGLSASYNSDASTYITLTMLGSVAALIAVVALFRKSISPSHYPLIVFGLALALLLNVSLFSQYLVGFDIFAEYSLFSNTLNNHYWSSAFQSSYNAMLSVTILPTMYSVVLDLSGTWLFKVIYPAIFAFVPLGLFMLFKLKMSREVAFFSVVFFISNVAFFTDLTQLARQMIGEVFYVLLLLTLFSDKIRGNSKWVLFAAFSSALIVSHYSLAYVFFASIAAVWIIGALQKRQVKAVSGSMVILFGVMTFAWFINTSSGAAFNNLLMAVESVRAHLSFDFFEPASRGTQVIQAIGGNAGVTSLWHSIGRVQFYIVEGLTIIGFLAALLQKRLKILNDDFKILIFCNLLILALCVILPNFAATFTASRFYQVALVLIAPLCVLGGLAALKFLTRNRIKRKYLIATLAILVLVPFFLFQTGFVYEIVQDDTISLPLSAYRLKPLELAQRGVVTGYEVAGANWLTKNQNASNPVYADVTSYSLFGYANITNGAPLAPQFTASSGSYVYLNQYNIREGVILQYSGGQTFNLSEMSPALASLNSVYSAGDCEIYTVP